ncbi:MAG: recombinase family protein [Actinobacteria bacterium]|nr:recombinase family protein [Actinomycetota bacterium]
MSEGIKVIGYVRVSAEEHDSSGALLDAQRRAISAECKRRGWRLLPFEEDIADGKATTDRPGLERALAACAAGDAQVLITATLETLSRSFADFGRLIERAQSEGWDIVVLDPALDLSTPAGRRCAGVLARVARWEREITGRRIKAALAVSTKKAGRPRTLPVNVGARIRRLHKTGHSYSEIARRLNAENVPTAHGGTWHASTVRKIVDN